MSKKTPIMKKNPIEDVLAAQGFTEPAEPEKAPAETKPETTGETAPADLNDAPRVWERGEIQYYRLFNDYVLPYKNGATKSRRMQLLVYPETQEAAAATAKALGISINELTAAALKRICDDYKEFSANNGVE